jgi:hypothetical protein
MACEMVDTGQVGQTSMGFAIDKVGSVKQRMISGRIIFLYADLI